MRSSYSKILVAGVFALAPLGTALTASGCHHEEAKPAEAPVALVVLTPASPGKPNSLIYLSEDIRKACGITTIESVKEAPKFAFDQAAITQEDRDVLAQIAQCLMTGPLKGRRVKLVGRADPRGTTQYNMVLGARRSDTVMKYLADLGVNAQQMTVSSRGALDATGDDPAAWNNDRRVDIDVMGAAQ
jgi:peptidoglycan-associated lipoprotein